MEDSYADLSTWQAVSHPELARRKPDELFDDGFAKRYRRLHHLLWKRIIRLHGTVRTLEELSEFPFDVIYTPPERSFWDLVIENFRDMSCIRLHALVNDSGSDAHSLKRFKNEINKTSWRDNEMLALFRETLAKSSFDKVILSIARRIDRIRDYRVAHQLVDQATGKLKEIMPGVTLEEVRKLFDAAHNLFGTLSFGTAWVTLPADLIPCMAGGKPNRSCLDLVLDAVLKDSCFVSQPELRGRWWQLDRDHMDSETLDLMNQLRARVGKPPA